jgi:hypothetical protein
MSVNERTNLERIMEGPGERFDSDQSEASM